MSPFSKSLHVKKIHSKKLLKLTRTCPECGALMTATGNMYLQKDVFLWSIEYWCPKTKEYFNIYTPETNEIAEKIARNP